LVLLAALASSLYCPVIHPQPITPIFTNSLSPILMHLYFFYFIIYILMSKFEPFTYKSLSDLRNKIKELGLEIPINPEIEILQQRVKLEDSFIPNRLAIQPMEGFDAKLDGTPTELTFRRYKRYAEGGAGLIWFEATAVSEDSRTNEHQLMLTESNLDKFKELVSTTRDLSNRSLKQLGFKNECFLVLQLNHSGRYSKKGDKRYPIRAFHSTDLNKRINTSKKDGIVISDTELEELEEVWVKKAILAKEAGFDGVDIKACHGYLISELLSSRPRKNSKYGGESLEKRRKFLLNIVKKLRKERNKNSNFHITSRLSAYTGVPYPEGFGVKEIQGETFPASMDLTEPIELIKNLYDIGVRLINISAGNPYYHPQVTRPYDTPVKDSVEPNEHPLCGVNRLINLTADIKKKAPKDMIIIGSGYSYLRQFADHVAAGLIHQKKVDICGFGRMAFANPNFPKQIFQEGGIEKKLCCIACSKCSQFMREGRNTGCAIRDPEYK